MQEIPTILFNHRRYDPLVYKEEEKKFNKSQYSNHINVGKVQIYIVKKKKKVIDVCILNYWNTVNVEMFAQYIFSRSPVLVQKYAASEKIEYCKTNRSHKCAKI